MPMTKDEPVAHSTDKWVYASGRTNPYPSPLIIIIIIITIIMIIIIDIYRAPFLSRAHSALQIQYTMHKQQSHLITCNLLTKHTHIHTQTHTHKHTHTHTHTYTHKHTHTYTHTHTQSINIVSLGWKKAGLECWSKGRN